ncbi:DUF1045 domain-containing protein [Bradyrhizobium brasilense]|uniref:DUF1045 domain-containing protein n=1 Tax=Bradyrhizobium brasilense TaxID=1419277 RepID=UPI0024B0728B|nr:DUF1045 domain-containing protein [Bradyrhizobium australafricanum]WFU33663.1 DUF1045 domain-containing protein [Bradyrhizobium australafricanum]
MFTQPLDEIETTHLVRWGYPYVFDRYRFHIPLTDRVPTEGRLDVKKTLEAVFAPMLSEDYSVDALSLFVQEHSSADFVVRSQFALRSRPLLKEAVQAHDLCVRPPDLDPSGAGEDTLIDFARAQLQSDPCFHFVRRIITRPPSIGEDHESIGVEEFQR